MMIEFSMKSEASIKNFPSKRIITQMATTVAQEGGYLIQMRHGRGIYEESMTAQA
jgi:hypothetical protein